MKRSHWALLLTVTLLLGACSYPARTKSERVRQKRQYLQNVQSQLTQFDARIAELKTRADHAASQVQADLQRQLAEVQRTRDAARRKANEVEAASEDAWTSLQAGTDRALDDLQKAYDQAAARFRAAGL